MGGQGNKADFYIMQKLHRNNTNCIMKLKLRSLFVLYLLFNYWIFVSFPICFNRFFHPIKLLFSKVKINVQNVLWASLLFYIKIHFQIGDFSLSRRFPSFFASNQLVATFEMEIKLYAMENYVEIKVRNFGRLLEL